MAGLKRLSTRQGTRPGIRLWTVKQAPFLQGNVPTYNLNPALVTFTPGMAKRTAPGPFAAAPIVQESWAGSATSDMISIPRGGQIKDPFYANIDLDRGSLVLWITPERDRDPARSLDEYYFTLAGLSIYVMHDGGVIMMSIGGEGCYRGYTTTAGVDTCFVFRWDKKNTLDGTNFCCITINDGHVFHITDAPSPATPGSTMWFGSNSSPTRSANALLEGLTIYRRPLWDGAYGIDVGNGDEISKIYAGGAGLDPCLVTGSWDICLCFPTNSVEEEIVTGEGEAWSHPHSSNLLGVGGFMLDGTYTNDGWADEGALTAVAALATVEGIFSGGYKVTSDAANEGIYKDYTCTAGDDFVIRVLGHSDGTSVPKAILYDQDNTTEIGSLTGSAASTRTAPDVFLFTGQAPAGCTTLRVKLINTDATADDITYWHQCELLANLIPNPSMEVGAGNPWIPTGALNLNLDAGDTEADGGTVHSGSGSMEWNPGSSEEYIYWGNPGGSWTANDFWAYGAWLYGDGGTGLKLGIFGANQGNIHSSYAIYGLARSSSAAQWTHNMSVWRYDASTLQPYIQGGVSPSGDCFSDDVYIFKLDPVSVTITPASEANCQESGGIRVVGRSICTEPIAGLKAKSGRLRFKWIPRHDAEDMKKFGSNNPYIAGAYYDANNRICLNYYNANDIELYINSQGVASSSLWSSTGAIVAGTIYLIEIEYNSISCTFKLDGIVKNITSPGAGIDFGALIPHTIYLGQTSGATQFIDAVYIAP